MCSNIYLHKLLPGDATLTVTVHVTRELRLRFVVGAGVRQIGRVHPGLRG